MLSAGQRRRVALAGVLLANAVLWLLDEPTTNLDADGQQLVRDLIAEQLARGGLVVAAVHHSLPLPRRTARGPGAGPHEDASLAAARLVALRDLRLAFRKPSQLIQPLMFFMIVATLFPLTLTPEMSRLRDAAPGVLWIGALLSSLLALEFLFRDDAVDGTLEQFALSGQSLTWMLFAKTCTHWLLTGLPLALSAPVAAAALGRVGGGDGRRRGVAGARQLRHEPGRCDRRGPHARRAARRGVAVVVDAAAGGAHPDFRRARHAAGDQRRRHRAADVFVRRDRRARRDARAAGRGRRGAYRTGVRI